MLVETLRPEEGVAVVRLNNPPLNLVTRELTRQLEQALVAIASDTAIRAVVVTGAGDRAFCAGSDIHEFGEVRENVIAEKLQRENAVWTQLEDLPQPTVAAIHAPALGGGFELALCCDLRVLDDGARVGLPEIRLGVFPGTGGPLRLTRLVGEARAKALIYFGDSIAAEEARALGLVNHVVPHGRTQEAALGLARRLAAQPAQAVQAAKRSVRAASEMGRAAALEHALHLSEHVFRTEDMLEGVAAFLEKRPPEFRHR